MSWQPARPIHAWFKTMSILSDRRPLWLALLCGSLLVLIMLFAWVYRQTQPVSMHDLHLAEGEKLKCVSYAPYYKPGQTPFDKDLVIPRQQIIDDLAALAEIASCVRLYSVDQGLDQVPAVARELGMKVLLGAWIGRDVAKNRVELDRAIALANQYKDVVRALIVGNEVLLRRERTPAEMRELFEYARARVEVPLTYADVWEFWIKNKTLSESLDFVTVHILPFWEDQPVAIEPALEHVAEVYKEVDAVFDKPLLIGETGWPSEGRQREGSRPSRVNQARYIREFVHVAHDRGWDYNLIEAIDQPWKRRLEGTVGGYWGMLDTQLNPKFPLAGPLAERDSLRGPLAGALIGAWLCLMLGWRSRQAFAEPGLRLAALGVAGAMSGCVMVLQAEHAWVAYRNGSEWGALGAVWLAAGLLPLALAAWQGQRLQDTRSAWRGFVGGARSVPMLLSLLRGVLLFSGACAALLLAFDPRYRDFPSLLYMVPALLLAPLALCRDLRCNGREEQICALLLALATIARWVSEPSNPQAIVWLLTGLLLAAAGWPAKEREQAQ